MDDYNKNLMHYFQEHLKRWPSHAALVAEWRGSMKRYVFWALMYEIGLHFRRKHPGFRPGYNSTLFEFMDYRLTDQEFDELLQKLRAYCSGTGEHVALAVVHSLIRLRLTRPLAWATSQRQRFGTLLGLQ
jgi:hypothetical protein